MTSDSDWLADRARYAKRAFLREQSLWAIWLYRFGRRVDRRPRGLRRSVLESIYWFLYRFVETITVISFSKSVTIGPGLRIWHFGGIYIHPGVVIGRNCTLRQGVTIGNREANGAVPVIGDNVEIGAGAQILGGIRIGNDARVGAMTLVLNDVPDGATVVGIPARVVSGCATQREMA
jgi:serine O-acetyltransferase